ncbi:MAG: hypothetical protein HYU66_17660 [Armatimonadetes bacterium]|nr:hypothetical protein [Armatimonadota bacterium]
MRPSAFLTANRRWALRRLGALAVTVGLIAAYAGCGDHLTGSIFSWTVTPYGRIVEPGGQAVFAINVASKVDINAGVAFAVRGLPAGATADISPPELPSGAQDATATITVPADTELGTYPLIFTATEAGQRPIDSVWRDLIVENAAGQPDFSLEIGPTNLVLDVAGGQSCDFKLWPRNNFVGTVDVSLEGLTDDLELAPAPTPSSLTIGPVGATSGGFVLLFRANGAVQSPVVLTFRAVSGAITHTRTITVTLPTGGGGDADFTLDVRPTDFTFAAQHDEKTFDFTVTPVNGFRGDVDMALVFESSFLFLVTGPSPDPVAITSDDPVSGNFIFYAFTGVPPNPPPTDVTLRGTSGALTHEVHVTVGPPPP